MESKNIMMLYLFMIITLSNSKSIVKNLPGFHGDLPFSLETGYVGVGEDNEIQVFYYFVESETDPSNDPLLIYLTGGPGTSGLYPLVYQIGPLMFKFDGSWRNNITLELNPYSWTKVANIIFVDLPVGVGFSYAETRKAWRSSDSILALHTYDFLRNWLVEHPKFLSNPLYISGISYMGIIVPIVALEAYKGNERGNQPRLNIKGCILVNPLSDKFIDFNSRIDFAHRVALISDDIYKSTKETCKSNYIYVDSRNSLCSNNLQRVDECTSRINMNNILDPLCDDEENLDPNCHEDVNKYLEAWVNDEEVPKALNVHEGTIETWMMTNETIHYELYKNDTIYYAYDVFSSTIYHKQLVTEDCQVLILSGDHDMVFPYVGREKWITSLNLTVKSPWRPWFVRTQIAGYQTRYVENTYSLTHSTIKGAGHAVALFKPEEALSMLSRWLASHTYFGDS